MSDIDAAKWWNEVFPWLAGIGTVAGASAAAFFGRRKSKPRGDDEEHELEYRRLQARVAHDDLMRDCEKVIEALRVSLQSQIDKIENRTRANERAIDKLKP